MAETVTTEFTTSTWRSNSCSSACSFSSQPSVRPDFVVEFIDRRYQSPEARKSLVKAQAFVRGWLARRQYEQLRLEDEMDADLEICIERHQRKSAIKIQRAFRAHLRRQSRCKVKPSQLPAYRPHRGGYSASSPSAAAPASQRLSSSHSAIRDKAALATSTSSAPSSMSPRQPHRHSHRSPPPPKSPGPRVTFSPVEIAFADWPRQLKPSALVPRLSPTIVATAADHHWGSGTMNNPLTALTPPLGKKTSSQQLGDGRPHSS